MDRRQRKTRRSIYAAFESLMASEHYGSVTVAQIIERADIGRSTFYAHFETKDALLAEMCREMFDHIFEGVNVHCVTHSDLSAEDLEGRLAHLLYHLRDAHGGVCGKLIREGEPHFIDYFESRLTVLFERDGPLAPTGVPADLMNAMQVSSFVRAACWWLKDDAIGTPEEVASWYIRLSGCGKA